MSEFKRTELGEKVVNALNVCKKDDGCSECPYKQSDGCGMVQSSDALEYIRYLEGLLNSEPVAGGDRLPVPHLDLQNMLADANGEIQHLHEQLRVDAIEARTLRDKINEQDREIARLSEESDNMGEYILHLIRNGAL